jgi:hypothetical protein
MSSLSVVLPTLRAEIRDLMLFDRLYVIGLEDCLAVASPEVIKEARRLIDRGALAPAPATVGYLIPESELRINSIPPVPQLRL